MQDRGHISAVMHNPTRTDTHTYAADPEWINQWCRGLTQGLPLCFVSFPRSLSLSLCFLLPLFTKINQVCIWRPLLPLPVTSGMKEWVRDRGREQGERRGNSQKRRQQYRHSWGVNCNNRSLLSRPVRIRSKMPGGRYDPETYTHTHTHTNNRHTQSSETAG